MSLTRTIRIPLVGRASFVAEIVDDAGAPFDLTNDHKIIGYVLQRQSDALSSALITLTSDDGDIVALNDEGNIFIALSTADVALLSSQALYYLVVTVVDAVAPTTVECVNSWLAICQHLTDSVSQPEFPTVILSTSFLNTLQLAGESGGTGYLDGLATVAQPVGCYVTFTPTGEQPQEWELVASTSATVAGATRRPLDYAADNQKVWFRRA